MLILYISYLQTKESHLDIDVERYLQPRIPRFLWCMQRFLNHVPAFIPLCMTSNIFAVLFNLQHPVFLRFRAGGRRKQSDKDWLILPKVRLWYNRDRSPGKPSSAFPTSNRVWYQTRMYYIDRDGKASLRQNRIRRIHDSNKGPDWSCTPWVSESALKCTFHAKSSPRATALLGLAASYSMRVLCCGVLGVALPSSPCRHPWGSPLQTRKHHGCPVELSPPE